MDGWMGRWVDGWMDGLIDEWDDVCNVAESANRSYDKALASVMELEYRTKEIGNLKKAGRREYPHALLFDLISLISRPKIILISVLP